MSARPSQRREQREAGVHFRLPIDERDRLKAEAAAAGLTLQQLFELRMLGAARPCLRRRSGEQQPLRREPRPRRPEAQP